MAKRGKEPIYARADRLRVNSDTGVAVVASYQTMPETDRPVKIQGRKDGEDERFVIVCLTPAEAEQMARNVLDFLGVKI